MGGATSDPVEAMVALDDEEDVAMRGVEVAPVGGVRPVEGGAAGRWRGEAPEGGGRVVAREEVYGPVEMWPGGEVQPAGGGFGR